MASIRSAVRRDDFMSTIVIRQVVAIRRACLSQAQVCADTHRVRCAKPLQSLVSSRRNSRQATFAPSSRLHTSIKLDSQPETEPGAPAAPPQQKPQVPGVRPGCSKQTDVACMTLVSVATNYSTTSLKDT